MADSKLLLFFALLLQLCSGELLQVIFVHRHGSRTRLGKNSTTLTESASQLTPEGMAQLYSVGRQARARYLVSPSCDTTATCLSGNWTKWSTSQWKSQSSALDRTLQSGESFLLGLLPPVKSNGLTNSLQLGLSGGIQPVPLYSLPLQDDWIIRAFGEQKCPAYLNNLQAFYKNNSYFLEESNRNSALLANLTSIFATNVTLPDIWNYFDAYTVQKEYGANTEAGGPALPALSSETLTQIKAAADWMEWNRYGNNSQASSLCGGGLLAQIMKNINDGALAEVIVPASIIPGPRLVHYSAHYGTLLCLLSAINITVPAGTSDPNDWLQKIPEYAALLAIEVHRVNYGDLQIKVFLQDGESAPYRQIVLPCGSDGTCTWDDFKSHVKSSTYTSVGQWCDACQNTTMTSCAAYNYLKSQQAQKSGATQSAALRSLVLFVLSVVLSFMALTW